MKDRSTTGTLADVARRILASDRTYKETERHLRGLYVLEVLVKNGGNQCKAAESIGISRGTVRRILRSLGMSGVGVQRIAKFIQEKANANS